MRAALWGAGPRHLQIGGRLDRAISDARKIMVAFHDPEHGPPVDPYSLIAHAIFVDGPRAFDRWNGL